MKIMMVDTSLQGHHKPYLKVLVDNSKYEVIVIVPEKDNDFKCEQIVIRTQVVKKRTLFNYLKWIRELKTIAIQNNVEVIHFLYGDFLYRYFAFGLSILKDFKTIATFHHMPEDRIRLGSVKRIFKKISTGVVHTEYIRKFMTEKGIMNVKHIEYPMLLNTDINNYYKLPILKNRRNPVLAAVGETRENKGLDILLKALQKVSEPFHLVIAGREYYFDEKFIKQEITTYSDNVTILLKYLSEEELLACYNIADIIVLPYKSSFGGASGPLVEGVWFKKVIVGPNCKSLGQTIKENELGFVFEPENIDSLARAIDEALSGKYKWNPKAEIYRNSLNPLQFKKKYDEVYQKIN